MTDGEVVDATAEQTEAEASPVEPEAPGAKEGEPTALLEAAGSPAEGADSGKVAATSTPNDQDPLSMPLEQRLQALGLGGAWVTEPRPATAAPGEGEGAAMQAAPPVGAGGGECGQGPVLAMCEGHGVGVEQEVLPMPAPEERITEGIPVQRPLPEVMVTDRPDLELGPDIFVQPPDPGGGCGRTDCGGWPGALLGSGWGTSMGATPAMGVCAGVPGIGSC